MVISPIFCSPLCRWRKERIPLTANATESYFVRGPNEKTKTTTEDKHNMSAYSSCAVIKDLAKSSFPWHHVWSQNILVSLLAKSPFTLALMAMPSLAYMLADFAIFVRANMNTLGGYRGYFFNNMTLASEFQDKLDCHVFWKHGGYHTSSETHFMFFFPFEYMATIGFRLCGLENVTRISINFVLSCKFQFGVNCPFFWSFLTSSILKLWCLCGNLLIFCSAVLKQCFRAEALFFQFHAKLARRRNRGRKKKKKVVKHWRIVSQSGPLSHPCI